MGHLPSRWVICRDVYRTDSTFARSVRPPAGCPFLWFTLSVETVLIRREGQDCGTGGARALARTPHMRVRKQSVRHEAHPEKSFRRGRRVAPGNCGGPVNQVGAGPKITSAFAVAFSGITTAWEARVVRGRTTPLTILRTDRSQDAVILGESFCSPALGVLLRFHVPHLERSFRHALG